MALGVAAEATGWICGKRLAPFLPELLWALEREGALQVTGEVQTALLALSAAAIHRRLARARREVKRYPCSSPRGCRLRTAERVPLNSEWDPLRDHPTYFNSLLFVRTRW